MSTFFGKTLASPAAGGAAFAAGDDDDDEDVDELCSTCLEPYDAVSNPRMWTKCGHHFHFQCVVSWLERKETCPICETRIDADDLELRS
jgi:hypothetical protein